MVSINDKMRGGLILFMRTMEERTEGNMQELPELRLQNVWRGEVKDAC